MCGISGHFSFGSRAALDPPNSFQMNRSLAHRGPDGEGYFFFGNDSYLAQAEQWGKRENIPWCKAKKSNLQGALGHRRLSIIDLNEKATQPMTLPASDLWIVFNGEIYNHGEIRKTLEAQGEEFFTDHSDTEVILHAYRKWGIDFLHRLRGMFAITILDFKLEKIFLVRDRIGVKPLYYTWQNQMLLFGSEIKALLRGLDQTPPVRAQSVSDYMSFLTVPAPHTMYEGIYKLPAGHLMEVNFRGESKIREYWNPLDDCKKETHSQEIWSERILEKLKESVKYRMVSDVPVGVFLSGGIDSSANAVLFSQLSKDPVKTFTIGYSDSVTHQNEFSYAKIVADKIHSLHHEERIQQNDLIDFLPKMVFHQDEPLADPVCIPLYFISKLARERGVTVCQVGEGADELFLGYTDWITKYKLQKMANFPLPKVLKKFGYSFLETAGLSTSTAREFLRRDSVGLPVFWSGAEAFTEAEKGRLFSPTFCAEEKIQSPDQFIRSMYDDFEKRAPDASTSDWMAYADLKLRLPELLLMRVDKMTMACGLEARVPFLDHEFVQDSFRIPESVKLKSLECKYLLKKAVTPLLPKEILSRSKQGFSVPVSEWLSDALGGQVEDSIRTLVKETGMFQEKEVAHFLSQKHRGVWNLFNLALWMQNRSLK